MSYTNLSFGFGSVLTSTKMTQMMDNFTALAQGLAGAPSILTAALDPATIHFLTSGTVINTTSGTTADFTSIPSWVKRITLSFADVSTNGTSNLIIQLGDSGGIETSGYSGTINDTSTSANHSSGFFLTQGVAAADVLHGVVILSLIDAATNTWCISGDVSLSSSLNWSSLSGSKSLSAVLDRIRLTTSGGANTFDAGKFNILYE